MVRSSRRVEEMTTRPGEERERTGGEEIDTRRTFSFFPPCRKKETAADSHVFSPASLLPRILKTSSFSLFFFFHCVRRGVVYLFSGQEKKKGGEEKKEKEEEEAIKSRHAHTRIEKGRKGESVQTGMQGWLWLWQ